MVTKNMWTQFLKEILLSSFIMYPPISCFILFPDSCSFSQHQVKAGSLGHRGSHVMVTHSISMQWLSWEWAPDTCWSLCPRAFHVSVRSLLHTRTCFKISLSRNPSQGYKLDKTPSLCAQSVPYALLQVSTDCVTKTSSPQQQGTC